MDTLLAFVPCVDDLFGTGCFSRHRDDEKVDGCKSHFGVDGCSCEDAGHKQWRDRGKIVVISEDWSIGGCGK